MKPLNRFQKPPRQIAMGALILTGLLLAGCVVTSVYPFYTAKDIVFEPKLLGRWTEAGETNVAEKYWEFARDGTHAYALTVQDGGEPAKYQAHLFRLKSWTFLDAMPVERHEDFLPPHYLLKVSQMEPVLKLVPVDYKWLVELLDKKPGALRHMRWVEYPDNRKSDSGRLVLTADTAELQKFILKHAGNTNAFAEGFALERRQ